MSATRKAYCPSCGTRITAKEFEYLRLSLASGLVAPCLTNPDCEGMGQ